MIIYPPWSKLSSQYHWHNKATNKGCDCYAINDMKGSLLRYTVCFTRNNTVTLVGVCAEMRYYEHRLLLQKLELSGYSSTWALPMFQVRGEHIVLHSI